jgi:hypothetical protein
LSIKKLITYYNKGAPSQSSGAIGAIGGDNMRMSVWDIDSEEDMDSDE